MNINWATGVITVFKTDSFMTFTGGSIYNMDTNLFRLALKDKEDDEAGIAFKDTHRHNTTVLLGGIEYARILEILAPYTVTFDDTAGGWVCNLIGSNNNILDRANLTTVQIRSNNSAGLVQMGEIQHGIFNEGVTVDTLNGVAGTVYPVGTPMRPVNNITDARTIAAYRGFKTLYIRGDLNLTLNDDVSDFLLMGENASRTYINVDSTAETAAVEIREATLTGLLDGGTIVRDSYIFDLSYVNGFLFQCELAGTIQLGGGFPAHIMNCFSEINETTIDFAGAGNSLNMQQSSGKYRFINKTGPDFCSIHITSGHLTFDSSITDVSNICAAGIGTVTDNTLAGVPCDAMVSSSAFTEAMFAQAALTPMPSNMEQVNGAQVIGDGSELDPWRAVGVVL